MRMTMGARESNDGSVGRSAAFQLGLARSSKIPTPAPAYFSFILPNSGGRSQLPLAFIR